MPRGCWCLTPTVEAEERKVQATSSTGSERTASERGPLPAKEVSQQSDGVTVTPDGSQSRSVGSSQDLQPQKSGRTATLQELTSKYKRGTFDPKSLANRSLQRLADERKVSDSTASPGTPPPLGAKASTLRKSNDETESNFTADYSDEVHGKDRQIYSTRSTVSNATSGRPQPIQELQNLLGVTMSTMTSVFSDENSSTPVNSATPTGSLHATTSSPLCSRELPLRSVKSQDQAPSERNLRATKSQDFLQKHSSCSQKENGRNESERNQNENERIQREKGRSRREKRKSQKESLNAPTVTQAVINSMGLRQASLGTPIHKGHDPHPGCISLSPWLSVSLDTSPLQGHPHYQILDILGGGTSGHVFVCVDRRTEEKVVVKMLGRGVSNAKVAEREIANLRLCGMHPYIIQMREVFLTDDFIAIAMDYADGGNLTSYIERHQSSKAGKGISEDRSRWIFYQIVVAVEYCHKMGFANRDIKLDNVLLVAPDLSKTTVPTVKLSDFGFSKDEYADSICKTTCGTPECVAPEVLAGGLYDGKFSDIWSVGVLFYSMLTGNYPFSRPADKELDTKAAMRKLFVRIMSAQFAAPQHISREAQDLLSHMLTVEPEQRIKVADILVHPFFTNHRKKSKMMSVNESLLQVSDSMLIGFMGQSDKEIAELLKEGSRQPASNGRNDS